MRRVISQTTLFKQHDFEIDLKRMSRYIQTTWRFSAIDRLELKELKVSIRKFGAGEAYALADLARKKNLFVRKDLRYQQFYEKRIKSLAGNTVIEVFRTGHPDAMIDVAQSLSDLVEKIASLSTSFAMQREKFQRLLGISSERRPEFNVTIGMDFYYLRSKSRPAPSVKGITIDKRFCKRFVRSGFNELVIFCCTNNNLAKRVMLSIDWLFESRHEPVLTAALVKTAVALESLLIFNESESLASTLSERSALILSSDPGVREEISKIIKEFYDARSGVVHGGRKNAKKLTPKLLESVDRLTLLLCLVVASNTDKWHNKQELQGWCNKQKWGEPATDIKVPFKKLYLNNAIKLGLKK